MAINDAGFGENHKSDHGKVKGKIEREIIKNRFTKGK